MFSNFFGPPHLPNGIIKPKQDTDQPEDPSKRGFLKGVGAIALVGAVGADVFGINEAKAEADPYTNNNKIISALNAYLKAKGYVLENPAANNIDIYNDCNKLIEDYNNGKFHKGPSKFYKPRSLHFMEIEKNRNGGVYPPAGLELIKLEVDIVIIGEVEGSKTMPNRDGFNPLKKGFAVLEKGTEIIRKKNSEGKWENYIKECFNTIYAGHKLCKTPPCEK